MAQAADLPGAAHLELVDGVVHLDPKPALLEAMLTGWVRQQRSRFPKDDTIKQRLAVVRRLVEFTNAFPWDWQPADGEAFIEHLQSENRKRPIMMSTGRGYETTLALFMTFLTDRRYGWPEQCFEQFGRVPRPAPASRLSVSKASRTRHPCLRRPEQRTSGPGHRPASGHHR